MVPEDQGFSFVLNRSPIYSRGVWFRLYRIIDPELSIGLPGSIENDLRQFFDGVDAGQGVDLKSLGLRNTRLDEVLGNLRSLYGLGD